MSLLTLKCHNLYFFSIYNEVEKLMTVAKDTILRWPINRKIDLNQSATFQVVSYEGNWIA